MELIQTWIPNGHLRRVTYTRYRVDTIHSPDDEHMNARNMYRFGINIYEKITVRQVGYLQELCRDASQQNIKKDVCVVFQCTFSSSSCRVLISP